MRVIIDRLEKEFAVVELPDRKMVNMPRSLLDIEAKEGDVIDIIINSKATMERKKKIDELTKELWD